MKYYHLILLTIISSLSFAQSYSIPEENSFWLEYNSDYSAYLWDFNKIYAEGDTSLNNKLFSKIYSVYCGRFVEEKGCKFRPYGETIFPTSYIGAIKTIGEKVIFIPEYETKEITIYDFSLSVGDSLLFDYGNEYYYSHILATDSILINNSYRKRLLVQTRYHNEIYWIEGIGSTNGLLDYNQHWEHDDRLLICYRENNISLYEILADCNLCSTVLDITDYQYNDNSLIVCPNPIINISTVLLNRNVQAKEVIIYDQIGQIVYHKHGNTNEITINKKDIGVGYFILLIIGKDNKRYRRPILIK